MAPRLVIIDTSCLYDFCCQNKHEQLKQFLGDRAKITLEVRDEIRRNVTKVGHLEDLLGDEDAISGRTMWPERIALNERQLAEVLQLAAEERRIMGGHTKQDLGELSTVICARDLGAVADIPSQLGASGFRGCLRESPVWLLRVRRLIPL